MRVLKPDDALTEIDDVLGEGTRLVFHQVFDVHVAIVSLGKFGQLRVILVKEPFGAAAV